MARVHRIAKARKDQGTCGACGTPLLAGMPYLKWGFRYGGVRKRCVEPACTPKASELTQNEILSSAYSIGENFSTGNVDTFQDLESMKDDVESALEEIIDLFEEKMSNIEEGFGHTDLPAYEDLENRKEEYEGWKDEVESTSLEEPECADCSGSGEAKVDCENCDAAGVLGIECKECDGTGTVHDKNSQPEDCAECDGQGYEKCMECNGEGEIEGQCETCGGDGHGPLTEEHKEELQSAIDACPE